MRVAVIGAGVVGITTAHALHADGHEVAVFERHGSIASEASFANAGVIAPGYVTPWAAPGVGRKVVGQLFQRDAAVRLSGAPGPALMGWLLRWQRACAASGYLKRRGAMLALAHDSLARTRSLVRELGIDYERGRGMLVLLRGDRELALARAGLKLLTDSGQEFHLVDAARCREVEPALNEATPLRAGIHLPDAEVGNCRQFTLQLKAWLQERGVELRLHHEVQRIDPGSRVEVHAIVRSDEQDGEVRPVAEGFDAVVVCAANGAPPLLKRLHLHLPLQPVHGYSVTLPVRQFEAHPDIGPRASLMDERYKVAISRLGDRLRVAGSAELGGRADRLSESALRTLYRVLDDWFPGAASHVQPQTWKGARPMLPDGPPAIGPSGTPGVWINTGHGSSGWALACGSGRLLADMMTGRASGIDPQPFSPLRWR